MSKDKQGFAARWSKKKAEARLEAQTSGAPEADETANNDESAPEPDGEMLSEADFEDVDFDALDKSSDYTRFIAANVPAAIQKKALRRLWASDEVFEVLDGMNDYDEDFTGTGLAGKALKTAYKVGRGFVTDDDRPEQPPAKSAESGDDDGSQTADLPENGPQRADNA